MNGILIAVFMIVGQQLGPVEHIYTNEYGWVSGQKHLDGPYAGMYNVLQSQQGPQAPTSQEQQFLQLVNQHRANHGLPPVGWSQEAANLAATNNAIHAPHSIMGRQNWASTSDFVSAFHMWVRSAPHNAMLLGIQTAIGVARCDSGCTANGY